MGVGNSVIWLGSSRSRSWSWKLNFFNEIPFFAFLTFFSCLDLIAERRSQGRTGYEHRPRLAEGVHGQRRRCINIGRRYTDQSPGSRPELRKLAKVAFLPQITSRAPLSRTTQAWEVKGFTAFKLSIVQRTSSSCLPFGRSRSTSSSSSIATLPSSPTRCKLIALILTQGLIL